MGSAHGRPFAGDSHIYINISEESAECKFRNCFNMEPRNTHKTKLHILSEVHDGKCSDKYCIQKFCFCCKLVWYNLEHKGENHVFIFFPMAETDFFGQRGMAQCPLNTLLRAGVCLQFYFQFI